MDLQTLSTEIEKKIVIFNHDVEARYLPNQREIQKLANLALDIVARDFEEIVKVGHLNDLPETQRVFSKLMIFIDDNIKTHHRWSFWHYSGLCLITCFAYLELLKQRKHQTIDLSKPETWTDPNWEVGVITLNYIAGKMYPSSLATLMGISEQDNINLDDLARYLMKQINIITA